jgi:hypothetical protein
MLKKTILSKLERSKITLSSQLKEILIGLLLGDLYAQKEKKGVNARLCFEQGTVHKDYLLHLYELFKSFCLQDPKIYTRLPDKRTGKIYSRISFKTCALPCFTDLYNLFYLEGKKIVPMIIAELLTPLSLMYWIADDATFCKSTYRVILCTESFTLAEINLLIKTLNDKWNLECYKVKRGKGYRIVIPRKSLSVLQNLLKDIAPTMMLHKIGL